MLHTLRMHMCMKHVDVLYFGVFVSVLHVLVILERPVRPIHIQNAYPCHVMTVGVFIVL